jgi:hypothetical protein
MKIRPEESEIFQADGCTDGRTDRHDEAKSLFLAILRKRTKKEDVRMVKEISSNKGRRVLIFGYS